MELVSWHLLAVLWEDRTSGWARDRKGKMLYIGQTGLGSRTRDKKE